MERGYLIKIPKKVDLNTCTNYKCIALLIDPGKIFNRIILNRMKIEVDEKLRDQQTRDSVNNLRIIIEQCAEWKSSLYVFDNMDSETIWKFLWW